MIKTEQANIKTKLLSFDLKDDKKRLVFVESLEYLPFLYLSKINDPDIDGNTIDPRDISYVKLHNSRFLPEIEISCEDSTGIFFTDLYPLDHDTLISIFVKSNSKTSLPIRMDFRLTEFESVKAQSKSNKLKYIIKGIIDIDDLHTTNFESRKGTSYDVLKKIAGEMSLGWASNVTSSDDEMKWINPSDTYIQFIDNVTKNSFISEKSFVWTFIDFYYRLNYINIETELKENNNQEQQTLTLPKVIKDDEEKTVDLYLTNNPAFDMTNKFISKFNLVNESFKVNLDKAYRFESTWYNKKENKVYKQFLADLKTDEQQEKTKELYDYKSPIYKNNTNNEYNGKIDPDNVHKNYALAKVTNQFNLENLGKMKMVVTLNQINFDIKRFQNLKVEIYNINDMFSKKSGEAKAINEKLSGFWYVTGINYIFRRNIGVEQELTLMRRNLDVNYGSGKDEKSDIRKLEDLKK